MSKISKFLGSPQEVEIKGEKITLFPLRVKDLSLFVGKENSTPEEQMRLSKEIIKKSLNDPEVTDEEVENMETETYILLMEEINKLNGFKDERLDRIKQLKDKALQTNSK
jgi:hypothetical protein